MFSDAIAGLASSPGEIYRSKEELADTPCPFPPEEGYAGDDDYSNDEPDDWIKREARGIIGDDCYRKPEDYDGPLKPGVPRSNRNRRDPWEVERQNKEAVMKRLRAETDRMAERAAQEQRKRRFKMPDPVPAAPQWPPIDHPQPFPVGIGQPVWIYNDSTTNVPPPNHYTVTSNTSGSTVTFNGD